MVQTYGQLFAANLRAARARADLSQVTVAGRMQRLGFTSWDSSKVSKSERGVGPVVGGELLALAVSLECTLNELVGGNCPPDALVEFPEPFFSLSGVNIRNSAYGYRDYSATWDDDLQLCIIRPVGPTSHMAEDKSALGRIHPSRLARTIATVDQVEREHPELTRPAC